MHHYFSFFKILYSSNETMRTCRFPPVTVGGVQQPCSLTPSMPWPYTAQKYYSSPWHEIITSKPTGASSQRGYFSQTLGDVAVAQNGQGLSWILFDRFVWSWGCMRREKWAQTCNLGPLFDWFLRQKWKKKRQFIRGTAGEEVKIESFAVDWRENTTRVFFCSIFCIRRFMRK